MSDSTGDPLTQRLIEAYAAAVEHLDEMQLRLDAMRLMQRELEAQIATLRAEREVLSARLSGLHITAH